MAKYIVTVSSSYEELIMMKTTVATPSDSDWGVIGDKLSLAPGRARDATQDKIIVASSVEDGSDIHVVTQQSSGRVAYHRFDPGTSAWTVEDEEVAVPRLEDTNFEARPSNEGLLSAGLTLRADGDVVLVAAFNTSAINATAIFVRTTGTWAFVSGSNGTAAMVCPSPNSSDDRTIFATETEVNAMNVYSLSSVDVKSAGTELDGGIDTALYLLGQGVYLSSDDFVVPYMDVSNKVSISQASIEDTPSLSQFTDRSSNTVYGNGRTTPPFGAFCLAVESDDTVHLLYADDTTQDLFHQPDATNATPPSEIEELDAVTVNRISCRVVNSDADLYVAYDDAGTLKFLDISLGAAPVVQRAKLSLLGVGV